MGSCLSDGSQIAWYVSLYAGNLLRGYLNIGGCACDQAGLIGCSASTSCSAPFDHCFSGHRLHPLVFKILWPEPASTVVVKSLYPKPVLA